MTRELHRNKLGDLRIIKDGTQGTVYRAPKIKLSGNLTGAVVFKEYKPEIKPYVDFKGLAAMTSYLESLNFAEGSSLVASAAWPMALVADDNGPCGFVMPEVPEDFWLQMKLPSGRTETVLSQFKHLLNSDEFLVRRGISLTDSLRYELLADVARTLNMFHSHRIAVGDLSPNNLLFSLERDRRCYFVDCDGMTIGGGGVMAQLETPDWMISSISNEPLATSETDCHKLALLALRLLAGSQNASKVGALPDDVARDIRRLIAAGLDPKPSARPAASLWTRPLLDASALAPKQRGRSSKPGQSQPSGTTTSQTTSAGRSPNPVQTTTVPNASRAMASSATAAKSNRERRLLTDAKMFRYTAFAVITLIVPYAIGRFGWRRYLYHQTEATPPNLAAISWPHAYLPELLFGTLVLLAIFGILLLRPPLRMIRVQRLLLSVVFLGAALFAPSWANRWNNKFILDADVRYSSQPISIGALGKTCGHVNFALYTWVLETQPSGSSPCNQLELYVAWKPQWTALATASGELTGLGAYSDTVVVSEIVNNGPNVLLGYDHLTGAPKWTWSCGDSNANYFQNPTFNSVDISVTCANGPVDVNPETGQPQS